MNFDFAGKRVIVCGGSRGIGRSIALGFAAAGASVSICARGKDGLDTTAKELAAPELAKLGGKIHSAVCDLGDAGQIAGYIADAATALGGIDVLVNNASGFGSTDDEAGWAASVAIDMMAVVRASQAAIPYLARQPGSSIVNISSISALRPATRTPPYGAIKAAVIHYTTSQAAALAKQGIRVNAVAPGSIEFPGGMWEERRTSAPQVYNAILASIPFGRLGRPEEIANTVMFLASPLASWITGQAIAVDGGQLL
jgi:3-oxoacyl-[acyl-carrier protein] reductase